MNTLLPYIVSVLCAVISGLTSYAVARKQAKADMQKLEKQHELDIEKEREKFEMEKEKMKLEHQYELERQQNVMLNQIGAEMVSTVAKEYIHTPEGKAQIRNIGTKKRNK